MLPKRILIIDDEDDIREIASMAFETADDPFEVSTARSGGEGIARAELERPDLILLDVMMPELDGPATLGRLRGGSAHKVPVIFLTAKVQSAELKQLADHGALGIIAKPFDPLTLPLQVASLAGWPEGH